MSNHRGVFRADFVSDAGNEVLIARTRTRKEVARATVTRTEHRDMLIRKLRQVLDLLDPEGHEERRQARERRKGLELMH